MTEREIGEILEQLYQQAKMQFGNAVRSRWMYSGNCPGCLREITALKYKGHDTLSLNAFIYRDHGVMIGYMLCGNCAGCIVKQAEIFPTKQTALHAKIEKELKSAYLKQSGH